MHEITSISAWTCLSKYLPGDLAPTLKIEPAAIIGISNRDLATFGVPLDTTVRTWSLGSRRSNAC